MTTKQQQARELFFQADLSQADIARLLKVNAKTVYRWIKQNHWERIKQAALNAPAVITEKLYGHLNRMCMDIGTRENEKQYPSFEESRTMLNIAATIKRLSARPSIGDHCESITGFMDYVIRKDYDKGQLIAREIDEYLLREAELSCWYDRNDIRYKANHLKPVRENISDEFQDGSSLKDENPPIQTRPDPYEEDEILAALAAGEPLTKKEKREINMRKGREQTMADYRANKANPKALANSGAYSGHKLREKTNTTPDEKKLVVIPPPKPNNKTKSDNTSLSPSLSSKKGAEGGKVNEAQSDFRPEDVDNTSPLHVWRGVGGEVRLALKQLFPNGRWEAAGAFLVRDIATNIHRRITDEEWNKLLAKGYTDDQLKQALG